MMDNMLKCLRMIHAAYDADGADLSAWAGRAADELERLRGEQAVLVRLLLEADKVVSTIEVECQEGWDRLADLQRAIAAATIPHRPEEADLLSLRACIGA